MPSSTDIHFNSLHTGTLRDLDDRLFGDDDTEAYFNERKTARLNDAISGRDLFSHPWDDYPTHQALGPMLSLSNQSTHIPQSSFVRRPYPFRGLHYEGLSSGPNSPSPITSYASLSSSPPSTPSISSLTALDLTRQLEMESASSIPRPTHGVSLLEKDFFDILDPFDHTLDLSLFEVTCQEPAVISDQRLEEVSPNLSFKLSSTHEGDTDLWSDHTMDDDAVVQPEDKKPSFTPEPVSPRSSSACKAYSVETTTNSSPYIDATNERETKHLPPQQLCEADEKRHRSERVTKPVSLTKAQLQKMSNTSSSSASKSKRPRSSETSESHHTQKRRRISEASGPMQRTAKRKVQYKEVEESDLDDDDYHDEDDEEEEFDPCDKKAKRTSRAKARRRAGRCPLGCGESFSRQHDIDRHLKTARIHNPRAFSEEVEETQSKNLSVACPDCGKQLSRWDAVKRHKESDACDKFAKAKSREE